MPIEYRVRYDIHLVWAEAQGILLAEDLFEYQRTVWGRPDVLGFHELVDMSGVAEIAGPSPDSIRALAALSASMDPPLPGSKFAIVAPDDLAFGLGRMYQTHRELTGTPTKEVAVFRTVPEALSWLGITLEIRPMAEPAPLPLRPRARSPSIQAPRTKAPDPSRGRDDVALYQRNGFRRG